MREEVHVPVQDSTTRVRQVKRLNLPIEILTTDQISDMDLVVDDLRPDLMERMEITLNWGMFRFAWDRERDAQGNAGSTFTFRRYQQGKLDSTKTGVANPIDAYGRWHLDLRAMIRNTLQVLVDGQNMMGIALVNHVGRSSAQTQYITFQATPPVVSMRFPQPFQVISDTGISARFEANLLYYKGVAFDTADAAWSLAPEGTTPDSVLARDIPALVPSDSVQELSLPLGPAIAGGPD